VRTGDTFLKFAVSERLFFKAEPNATEVSLLLCSLRAPFDFALSGYFQELLSRERQSHVNNNKLADDGKPRSGLDRCYRSGRNQSEEVVFCCSAQARAGRPYLLRSVPCQAVAGLTAAARPPFTFAAPEPLALPFCSC
jgi:hypothetical protein